jgi:hypothetical protein
VGEIASVLTAAPAPDADFVNDVTDVLDSVGTAPEDPWERS